MGKMDAAAFRKLMKEPASAREATDLVYRAYLEHGTLGRTAFALGLTPSGLDHLLHEYPTLREARSRAWSAREARGLHVVRGNPRPKDTPAPPSRSRTNRQMYRDAMADFMRAGEVRALVYRACLENATLDRAAVALGLTRLALDNLIRDYPALAEAQADAWRVREARGLRVPAQRTPPKPAEVPAAPPPPPPRPRRRRRG